MKSFEASNLQFDQNDLQYKLDGLTAIINSFEAGVYVADYHTGEILFANQKTADFIGGQRSAEDLIGKTCWNALNKDTNERCEFCAYKRLISPDGEFLEPYTWERYFEEYGSWAKITNQAIRWVDGRIAQITTFHNISEMKQMQEMLANHIRNEEKYKMQQNLQTLLDRLPVAIGITDVETVTLVYANRMFVDMFEYENDKVMLGRSTMTLIPESRQGDDSVDGFVKEIMGTKGINAYEFEFITATGRHLDTRLTTCTMDFNGRRSSVGIITDLAAEKEQQRLLIQAAESEREANQLKSRFLSNMSHEIRTPLNAIMGITEILAKSAGDKEKTLDSVGKLSSSSRHLLSIVNDILDMAKIESGKFELSYAPFRLRASLEDVLGIIMPRCVEKRIFFAFDAEGVKDFSLYGDKTRINQVLINLLGNAVKFTNDAGRVDFWIETAEETETSVRLKFFVQDNGIGIGTDRIQRLFKPYEQGDSSIVTLYGGTGLGLSISHNLVNMMGGTLRVESELDKGSLFFFELVLQKGEVLESCEDNRPESLDLQGKRILLAEDVAINREIVCELLAETGVSIDTAENGQIALDIFECAPPGQYDLIFMDIQMPVMDGYEAARRIRALNREDAQTIPILAMTANAYTEDVERSLAAGMNSHLSKPIEIERIIQALRKYMGS